MWYNLSKKKQSKKCKNGRRLIKLNQICKRIPLSRFLFIRLFAAVIIIAIPCCNAQYDDYSDYLTNTFSCPNEECINPDEPVTEPIRYRVYYYMNIRHACCKLSGLRPGDYIGERFNENQQKRLRQLVIEDGKVESIPKNLMTKFDPTVLRMSNGVLKTLTIADFSGAVSLSEFNATNNLIEKLEPNVFAFAQNIETIDLSNNRIVEVSRYAFDNLAKLEVLVLSNNLIATLDFKSKFLELTVFMASNNSLVHLNESLFEESPRLTDLCLNQNKLNISRLNVVGNLDVFDMSDNPMSIYLSAKNMKIRNSNVKMLNISKTAIRIDASDNQISSIVVDPDNILIELILSRNNYTTMQNLTALKSIESLDLSFNLITDIDVQSFSHLSQLKTLNLENSGLKTIDFGLFSQQTGLTWLDISYNNLNAINFNMLTDSIHYLFIEGNSLTKLDVDEMAHTLPNLRILGLANNKFSCEKLVEIRNSLKSHSVEMHIDEQAMVKFSRNINGIACASENSTETIELTSSKLLPIHTSDSQHNQFIQTIQQKINEIEANIRVHSESLNENSINSKDDLLSMKQELMDIRNDGELKIIDAKADILMSVSRLFNVSTNDTNTTVDLKATVEELNKINLERYQSLSSQLKVVKDKLQDLAQSMGNLKTTVDSKSISLLKQRNGRDNDDISADGSSDLISLKKMMTFVVVTVVGFVTGFLLFIFYKRFHKSSGRRRYMSTNTIDTTVGQSLV